MLRTNVILVLRGPVPAVVRCQGLSTVALDRASSEALKRLAATLMSLEQWYWKWRLLSWGEPGNHTWHRGVLLGTGQIVLC